MIDCTLVFEEDGHQIELSKGQGFMPSQECVFKKCCEKFKKKKKKRCKKCPGR